MGIKIKKEYEYIINNSNVESVSMRSDNDIIFAPTYFKENKYDHFDDRYKSYEEIVELSPCDMEPNFSRTCELFSKAYDENWNSLSLSLNMFNDKIRFNAELYNPSIRISLTFNRDLFEEELLSKNKLNSEEVFEKIICKIKRMTDFDSIYTTFEYSIIKSLKDKNGIIDSMRTFIDSITNNSGLECDDIFIYIDMKIYNGKIFTYDKTVVCDTIWFRNRYIGDKFDNIIFEKPVIQVHTKEHEGILSLTTIELPEQNCTVEISKRPSEENEKYDIFINNMLISVVEYSIIDKIYTCTKKIFLKPTIKNNEISFQKVSEIYVYKEVYNQQKDTEINISKYQVTLNGMILYYEYMFKECITKDLTKNLDDFSDSIIKLEQTEKFINSNFTTYKKRIEQKNELFIKKNINDKLPTISFRFHKIIFETNDICSNIKYRRVLKNRIDNYNSEKYIDKLLIEDILNTEGTF